LFGYGGDLLEAGLVPDIGKEMPATPAGVELVVVKNLYGD